MPLPKRKVEAGLRRKGFVQDENDHHLFFYVLLNHDEAFPVWTKTSHGTGKGKKEIDDGLLTIMARQCRLRREEFVALIQCPMSREEYERILREKGFVP